MTLCRRHTHESESFCDRDVAYLKDQKKKILGVEYEAEKRKQAALILTKECNTKIGLM